MSDTNKKPTFAHLAYMLGLYSNKTIPQTYIGEFSNYELLLSLMNKVNEIIQRTTEYDDIMKEIQALLDDIDDTIKADIIRIINEMYESGEFDDVLKEVAEDFLTSIPLNTDIDFARIYRQINIIGDNRRYLANSAVRPSRCQSGCCAEYPIGSGIIYNIYTLIPSPTGNDYGGYENSGVIVINRENDNTLAGQVRVVMGHMNSICYNAKDGYLYVAWTISKSGSTDTPDKRVSRVLLSDILGKNLNVTDYRDTMDSVSYDTITVDTTGTDMGSVGNLSYEDSLNSGEIYIGSRGNVYKFDYNNNKILSNSYLSQNLSNLIDNLQNKTDWTWQNAIKKDNYVYIITYKPNQIIRCNLTTQAIEYIYHIPSVCDNGNHALGEPEAIYLNDNGDMYIFTANRFNDKDYAELDMIQIFKQNIYKNNIPLYKRKIETRMRATVYVNRLDNGFNPDGTSAHPFKYLPEAVYWAANQTCYDGVTIELKTDSTWFIQISTNKNIRITNSDNPAETYVDENGRASIGGVHCNGCGTVSLNSLRVYQSINNDKQSSYIYVLDGNYIFNNLKIVPSSGATATKAYDCKFANIILTGASNFTVGVQQTISGETVGVVWDSLNESSIFMTGTCFSANCHGFANLNPAIIG